MKEGSFPCSYVETNNQSNLRFYELSSLNCKRRFCEAAFTNLKKPVHTTIQRKSRTLSKAKQGEDFPSVLKKLNNPSKRFWKFLHQLYPLNVSEQNKMFTISLDKNTYRSFQNVGIELTVAEVTIEIPTAVRRWLRIPCHYILSIYKCINHAVGSVDPRSLSYIKIFQLLINHDVTTYQNSIQTDIRDTVTSTKLVLSHECTTFLENKYNLDLRVWRIHSSF